jgi:hypothetical protein
MSVSQCGCLEKFDNSDKKQVQEKEALWLALMQVEIHD